MTGKLPALKPKDVIAALTRAGFYVRRQSGSHARLLHRTRPELRVTVPIHNKDLPLGTLRNILRQANVTPEEFEQRL